MVGNYLPPLTPTGGEGSSEGASPRRLLVRRGDRGRDAAARRERADDPAARRLARRHEVVEQAVDDRLVKDALVAVALQIELQRLQLHAAGRRRVGERD